ncbi:hypothetical protein E2320_001887 [Naja naja]|nr:hypothetical protein E2320_001887 [Naja naja]
MKRRKKKIMPIQILRVHPVGLNTVAMIAIHTDIKQAEFLKNPEILFALCCSWNDRHNFKVACDLSNYFPKHVLSVFKPVLKNIQYMQ